MTLQDYFRFNLNYNCAQLSVLFFNLYISILLLFEQVETLSNRNWKNNSCTSTTIFLIIIFKFKKTTEKHDYEKMA